MTFVLLLAACGGVDDLGGALPSAEMLEIGLPARAGLAKPGEPSELWLLTRRTAETLNGMIGSVVGTMAGLLREAQTAPGLWGPFTPPLSPVTYRLLAARVDGKVVYHLDARPKGGGPWDVIIVGVADGNAGQIHVDLARLRALDPLAPQADALAVAYEEERRALTLDEAHYAYAPGELAFAGPDGAIHARWRDSGAGRAEVSTGLVECWDDDFQRVDCPDVP